MFGVPWARRFRMKQYLRGSLWFLPLVGGVAGSLLAVIVGNLERRSNSPGSSPTQRAPRPAC